MTNDNALAALARVARLKSDLEMRRFSAFRAHVAAVESRIDVIRDELSQLCDAPTPPDLDDLRLAVAVAGRNADALLRAQADLTRMMPGFDAARAKAAREFGRAQVLSDLQDSARADRRAARMRAASDAAW